MFSGRAKLMFFEISGLPKTELVTFRRLTGSRVAALEMELNLVRSRFAREAMMPHGLVQRDLS